MVEIVQHIPEDEWKRFLDGCSDATLYHTPEWKTLLEKTFDFKPYYLFATDECGQLTGMLPLFQVKSMLKGNRLCSVPFSPECGCLGDDATCTSLIDEAMAIKTQCIINKIEIRNSIGYDRFWGVNAFFSHILDLSVDPEDTLKRVNRNVRRGIKKSEHFGVSVTSSTHIEDLMEFYELNCLTKKRLGIPCHPWKFFANLFSVLDVNAHLYLSHYRNQIIAGGIMISYKDRVMFGYSASDPAYLQLYPNYPFIWKSIEDACVLGYRFYDFGRTSFAGAGLRRFKIQWGARERELCYCYYPVSDRSVINNRNSSLCRLGNSVIRRMPMSMYKVFSASVFSHIG